MPKNLIGVAFNQMRSVGSVFLLWQKLLAAQRRWQNGLLRRLSAHAIDYYLDRYRMPALYPQCLGCSWAFSYAIKQVGIETLQ